MTKSPYRIAVLISGGGTTLKNPIDRISDGSLDVEIGLVVSSSSKAGGLEFAQEAGIPYVVIPKKEQATDEEFSEQVFGAIRRAHIDLVVMGGFLKHVLIPDDFENRVINIHPSLIPAFCGHGFYGLRVHQAVLDKGCKITGCTVHFVDNEYDHGPIIAQVPVPVEIGDSSESLQKRVFHQECEIYPQVIQMLATENASPNA